MRAIAAVGAWVFVMVVGAAAGGCLRTGAVECADGRTCPENTRCGETTCIPMTCGDGVLAASEPCDGDQLRGVDCTSFGYYAPDGLACSEACTLSTDGCTGGVCGDGITNGPEACDLASPTSQRCGDFNFDLGRVGCAATCTADLGGCERIDWTVMTSGTAANLSAVWGASPSDVFAVGDGGTILHWDGAEWSPSASPTTADLNGVSGTGPSNAFAVGAGGTILHWDGAAWTSMTSPTTLELFAVSAVSPSRAFAVGASGTVVSYDGTAWTAVAGAPPFNLYGVWASAAVVFVAGGPVVGARETIASYDGSTWTSIVDNLSRPRVMSLWGSAADDVYAVGTLGDTYHFTGATPATHTPLDVIGFLLGVWGSSATDVYAVGTEGAILHTDGTDVWAPRDSRVSDELRGIWGFGPDDIFVVGTHGRILRYTGVTFSTMPKTANPTNWVYALWGTSRDDIEAVSAGSQALRWDGATWREDPFPPPVSVPPVALRGLWGSTTNDLIAVGTDGAIRRRTASGWTAERDAAGETLYAVWGSAAADVFAVGATTAGGAWILHYDGASWTPQTPPAGAGALFGVAGRGPADVYAVGDGGQILHYDGAGWSAVRPASSGERLDAVWVDPAGLVIGVGTEIVHGHDTTWTPIVKPKDELLSVWGSSSSDVFATGAPGAILHFDGAAWVPFEPGTSREFQVVWGAGGDVVFGGQFADLHRLRRGCSASETRCSDHWDDDCDGLLDCDDPDCDANPSCASGGRCRAAATAACGTLTGTTRGGPLQFDAYPCSPRGARGPEAYYRFVAPTSGDITARLTATNPELGVTVLGAGGAGACDLRQCLGAGTEVTFSATAGATYFLVVDGPDGAIGDHGLEIICP